MQAHPCIIYHCHHYLFYVYAHCFVLPPLLYVPIPKLCYSVPTRAVPLVRPSVMLFRALILNKIGLKVKHIINGAEGGW